MRLIKGKVILYALVVGAIYILPHILFILEEGKNYHLSFKMYEWEARYYAARVREQYDGNYLSSDPYTFENKTKPYIRPFLSEYIVGTLGRILGLSIDNLFILGDFLFPIVIFCLFFYFLNLLVRSQSLSLLGAMVILLAEIPDSLTALLKLSPPETFILTFARPIYPQFSYIFFIASLIFIYKSLINGKIMDILLSSFFLGLLLYIYFYHWIYIFVGLAVLSLYLALKRQLKQIKIIFFILTWSLALSIPFWINYLRLIHLPFYNEPLTRIGLMASHHIFILKLSPLVLITFVIFYRKRDFNFLFLFSFLFGSLLCMNQQVLTGWKFVPEHWYYYADKQMAVVAGILLLDSFLKGSRFRERFIGVFLITGFTFSICMGISIQVYNYEKKKYIQHQQQDLYEALVWLQNNTKKDDVVLASDVVSMLIPIHTHNNVYWSSAIIDYANSDKDILERFFLLARLFGMNEDEVVNYILTYRGVFFGNHYEEPLYQKSGQKARVNLVQDLYDYIIQCYRVFKREDLKTVLRRFRVDYLFYGPYEQLISQGRFKKDSFLDKFYDSRGIQIYKIIR